jgi:hypothetical protein
MYQFKETIDRIGHFWFDKKLIENKNWAALPPASKSVYPVIACYGNEKGESFPGEQTIAILSGRTDKIVRKGIVGLEDFPGVTVFPYITRRGRRSKRYIIERHKERGRCFPFYREVFEAGNWLHLKPSAQALYPVMRHYGYFDVHDYDTDLSPNDFFEDSENFRAREYEFCEAEIDILAEYAGITKRSVYDAIKNLEQCKLIEKDDYGGWKVFLHPQGWYERSYLNQKIIRKYRHIKQSEE